jgi:hypothetical protein
MRYIPEFIFSKSTIVIIIISLQQHALILPVQLDPDLLKNPAQFMGIYVPGLVIIKVLKDASQFSLFVLRHNGQ